MKKRLAILMGALALSVFTACGTAAPADPDDDIYYEDDEDWDEEEDEVNAVIGDWQGENVFVLMYTFKPDGTYHFCADGGATDDGSYEFDGTDLLLVSDEDGYQYHFEYRNGILLDDDGTEYEKTSGYAESDFGEPEYYEEEEREPVDEVVGYWEGINMPPNDWFIFTWDGEFYCNRDNGYIECGTYSFWNNNVMLTYDETGETDSFCLLEEDYMSYEPCDGLMRLTNDDTVDDWILEEVGQK